MKKSILFPCYSIYNTIKEAIDATGEREHCKNYVWKF